MAKIHITESQLNEMVEGITRRYLKENNEDSDIIDANGKPYYFNIGHRLEKDLKKYGVTQYVQYYMQDKIGLALENGDAVVISFDHYDDGSVKNVNIEISKWNEEGSYFGDSLIKENYPIERGEGLNYETLLECVSGALEAYYEMLQNNQIVREVTESVMRKLRESEDADDAQKYEDALLGASLFWETANYPYYYELRNIGEIGVDPNGNVDISNRYGDGITLTSQEADDLIERGVIQGGKHGTVMLFRNPQERGEVLSHMVAILKMSHPEL